MPQMLALKSFPYNGQKRQPGERFEASPRAAKIFKSVGKAEDAPADAAQSAAPAPAAAPESRADAGLFAAGNPQAQQQRGRHRRRDMRAED